MQIKANFWVEKDGEVVLSRWRVALLRAIDESGSISAAAERMGIPYRRAWDRVHECEERLGLKLIDTQTGGLGGGGAQLTPKRLREPTWKKGRRRLICPSRLTP
jgi:molybdate transport system regulatory protein